MFSHNIKVSDSTRRMLSGSSMVMTVEVTRNTELEQLQLLATMQTHDDVCQTRNWIVTPAIYRRLNRCKRAVNSMQIRVRIAIK